MDTSLYISKIEEHLANPYMYKKLNSDPTQAIRKDVLSTLDYLQSTHQIDGKTRHHLTLPKPARTPFLYGLPKIHKPNISLQPIVSACDSPTDQLQTMSSTSYNLLWRYSPRTSRTANTFYSSLNPSHLCGYGTLLEENLIISQYPFLPENNLLKLSFTASPKPSSTPVAPFSTEHLGYLVPEQFSQL